MKARSQWSPYLEKCCLLVSANSSCERSAEDLRVLTGIAVSSSTQQRLVHRQQFELPAVSKLVEEMSLDGGKVRLGTAVGKSSEWRDYKGINLDGQVVSAFYRENERLSDWVNQQPLAIPVSCLGDGHDGIWNMGLFALTPEKDHSRSRLLSLILIKADMISAKAINFQCFQSIIDYPLI